MVEFILRLVLIIAGALLLVDLVSLFGGFPSLIRWFHHRLRGYIEVVPPDDLHTAWVNGLIRKGDELLVGYQHEGNAGEATCFAISPGLAGCPVGTRLRVVGFNRKRLVLRKSNTRLAVRRV